ncbi:M3 family metallopeptidase [Parasulfitobacter algicola]|uniref:M3 family metallopeptidase n=1 Tax=Parasulfitobacter algicola TaxID=2614809 RepID=A0ABX2ITC5_9RHOB|nr:M3 family metallopeptidase [Sulfitobacter algicola]NSX56146.1 M3 family metallopeptidase [Sulfitobacter algicola]
MTNPLLIDWTTPFEIPPFDQIQDSHFQPAFDITLADARAKVDEIAKNPEPPTFKNTVEALELADKKLGDVLSVFYTLAGTDSNPAREELQRVFSPELAKYGSDVSLNADLFARIETLWATCDNLGLTDEQHRVLDLKRRNFVRAGAALAGADRERLKEITQRLAVLGTQFGQNLLADERDWFMELGPEDMVGLPDFLIQAATATGTDMGKDRAVITLSRSLIVPFLQFSSRRDLREAAYDAWTSRGAMGGETDNRALTTEMLELRAEMAQLLGYDNFAAYKLETEMAGTADRVRELLMQVWDPARAAANADAWVLEKMMQADGVNGDLEPWDWRYYSEKRRKADHDLDEAELKPYLQLDRMIEAAFTCSSRLFNLDFEPLDLPLYHPDCRAWEVTRNGEHIAVFIGDYFARAGKRSGAWCSALRAQQRMQKDIRPIVMNVCNFAKPPADKPALLSYDDARTLFHEFGHALHQMLSDVTYEMISGTSVPRDFVELPSQLYEHWLEVPDVLAEFAVHAETGDPMPQDMLKRLLAASNYDMGFQTVEYVASALVDLEFHDGPAPADTMEKQVQVLEQIGMPNAIRMRHATPHFAHVFSGGYYASSYYSYMWSEVMDADAFAAFQEAGSAFDPETAKKLEEHILSKGNSVDSADLYIAFRGRLPGVEALLKGRGLNTAA